MDLQTTSTSESRKTCPKKVVVPWAFKAWTSSPHLEPALVQRFIPCRLMSKTLCFQLFVTTFWHQQFDHFGMIMSSRCQRVKDVWNMLERLFPLISFRRFREVQSSSQQPVSLHDQLDSAGILHDCASVLAGGQMHTLYLYTFILNYDAMPLTIKSPSWGPKRIHRRRWETDTGSSPGESNLTPQLQHMAKFSAWSCETIACDPKWLSFFQVLEPHLQGGAPKL